MVTATVPERELIDPGEYAAKFLSVEAKRSSNGDYWRWTFELTDCVDSRGRPVRLGANSSCFFGPKARAHAWARALTGLPLSGGMDVDFEDLAGTLCRLHVSLSDDGQFNQVDAVLPASQGRRRPMPADEEIEPDDLPF
jgi:hypothetical protein